MNPDFGALAEQIYGSRPHPKAPSLNVRDFPTAVKLATATKFGGIATAPEAEMFWKEFHPMGMEPGHYMDTLNKIAPLSFRFHNRPPTMEEIKLHGQAPPDAAFKYYTTLPDKDYPDVQAGHMVKALAMSDPYAQRHLGRGALKNEARFIHHAQMGHRDVDAHYLSLKQDREEKNGPS